MSSSDNKVKKTREEKELARIAGEKWDISQEHMAPLMDRYMAQTDRMLSDEASSYTRGRVNEQNQVNQLHQRNQLSENIRVAGLDPSSGRALMTHNQGNTVAAAAGGETTARAEAEQSNQHTKGLQTITALGSGQSANAQAGMGQIASNAVNQANHDAVNTFNRSSANMQLLGTVAGAATSYGLNNDWFSRSGDGTGMGIQPNTGPVRVENNPNVQRQPGLNMNVNSNHWS